MLRTKSVIWLERLGRWLHDQVDALAEHVEIEVGDEGGDLDQRVGAQVEPGHLAVDPDESFVHVASAYCHAVHATPTVAALDPRRR